MAHRIRYRLGFRIIGFFISALIMSGCTNTQISTAPATTFIGTSNKARSEITPSTVPFKLTVGPSSTPAISGPTISTSAAVFRAWLRWKSNFIDGLAWSPDSRQIATVAGDVRDFRRVFIINLSTLRGSRYSEDAPDPAIAFSPDGKDLVVGSLGLEIWDVSNQRLLGTTRTAYDAFVAYLPNKSDSFLVALSYPDNSSIETIALRATGESPWDFQPFLNVKGFLRNISLNSDGTLLATATKYFDNAADPGEHVLVWELASKKQICSLDGMDVAFRTSDSLGTAAADGISIWNARTCALKKHFASGPGYPYSITFSPDGKMLAFSPGRGRIRILDADSGATVQELDGMLTYVDYIRFSPDGQFLATINRGADPTQNGAVLIIWKVADGSLAPIEITPEFFKPAN